MGIQTMKQSHKILDYNHVDMYHCPRCYGRHLNLRYRMFKKYVIVGQQIYDLWATCPRTKEPLIMGTQLDASIVRESLFGRACNWIGDRVVSASSSWHQ